MSQSQLSLGISPGPNDTFTFAAWVHGQLPDAAAELDVVKVSYAAVPELLDRYALLPSGSALGRGCGPLVVTLDRESLAGARVAIPGRRTTAYLLFRLWAEGQGVAAVDVLAFDK